MMPDLDVLRTPHTAPVRDDVSGHLDSLAATGTLVTSPSEHVNAIGDGSRPRDRYAGAGRQLEDSMAYTYSSNGSSPVMSTETSPNLRHPEDSYRAMARSK